MTLADYLLAAARTPWQAAVHDCSAWPARWAGIPLPTYSTDDEGAALIADAGGLVALWERCIAGRLDRADKPEAGDVGIIAAFSRDGPAEVGAIFTGKRWAFVTPNGLAVVSAIPVAIWSVPCPRP